MDQAHWSSIIAVLLKFLDPVDIKTGVQKCETVSEPAIHSPGSSGLTNGKLTQTPSRQQKHLLETAITFAIVTPPRTAHRFPSKPIAHRNNDWMGVFDLCGSPPIPHRNNVWMGF